MLASLACGAAVMTLSACVRPPPYNPFKTPSEEVRKRVHTIALAPLAVNPTLADPVSARAELEPIVTGRLQSGGFAVLPSEEMEKYWRRAADDVGPVYDPVTGEVDKTRFETVQAAVFRELGKDHHVDAVLFLKISAVVLYLPGSTVNYCGTTTAQMLYWPPQAASMVGPATAALVLCLNTGLYDLEGRELYNIRHGLEPIETYAEQTRAVRPMAERLREPARIAQAIEATVGPLANAGKLPAE